MIEHSLQLREIIEYPCSFRMSSHHVKSLRESQRLCWTNRNPCESHRICVDILPMTYYNTPHAVPEVDPRINNKCTTTVMSHFAVFNHEIVDTNILNRVTRSFNTYLYIDFLRHHSVVFTSFYLTNTVCIVDVLPRSI